MGSLTERFASLSVTVVPETSHFCMGLSRTPPHDELPLWARRRPSLVDGPNSRTASDQLPCNLPRRTVRSVESRHSPARRMSNGPTSQPISNETAMIPVAASSGAALCLSSGARLCVLIGCLFHLKEARYRGRIGEREDLGRPIPADAVRAIDPVVQVSEARP